MTSAVDVRDVFRVYASDEGDVAALQGLTLAVQQGEVVVVLGPSGSGKTTLLRILAGLDRPSAGAASVFGIPLGKIAGKRLADYRATVLGYVDQHYTRALAPELTARELVGLRLGLLGVPRAERDRRADELIERVGLSARRDARPAELSGGEQQRIAVCAALAHRPRLLLADEPTGELDAANARALYGLIGELVRAEGTTTIVVSHDPSSATIADRAVHVRDGRVSEEAARSRDGRREVVVGRGGWVRLPEELLARAGIGSRATARVENHAIVVAATERAGGHRDDVQAGAPGRRTRASGAAVAAVRSVEKTFGRGARATPVLRGVTASFEAGKVTAVTGPSGSGKTTLLHLLAGLDLASAGDVVVLETSLGRLDRAARAAFRRDHVALVEQAPAVVPFLSAVEDVELALAIRGVAPSERRERALDALHAVGLAERAEQRVSRLSAGERQRVAIARALAARPAVLLADEPTARLDQANALAIASLFADLARDSATAVVCATHDPIVIERADERLALDETRETPAPMPTGVAAVRA